MIGITLVYCGAIALFAWFGSKTATRLDTASSRLVRHWGFWFAPAMLIFADIIFLAAANVVLPAVALVIPYPYFAAVGINREGRG